MAEPLIVFFDTFTHNEQTQENTDCVRFKSGIQLFEIRILPFGSVVESILSDEPLIGATNPAAFDVILYSNSQTNCITLHNIAKHHFDEKSGVNTISLKEPVHSNFLLFRGKYSTLTVALLGLPTLPMNPTLHHGTNLSVPPPQLSVSSATPCVSVEAVSSDYQQVSTSEKLNFTKLHGSASKDEVPQVNPGLSWSHDNLSEPSSTETAPQDRDLHHQQQQQQQQKLQHQSVSDSVIEAIENTGAILDDRDEPLKNPPSDIGGLYEDGEIQDIDYEEISSNEELFSEIDENDLVDDGQQTTDLLNTVEPVFNRLQWRFNPWNAIDTISIYKRQRITDPCLTLFEMHRQFLDHSDRNESRTTVSGDPEEAFPFIPSHQSVEQTGQSVALLPSADEWSQASTSAQFLLAAAEKFSHSDVVFDQMWVEAMENMDLHLAIGLAFLYHTDKNAFNMVCEALIFWVYTGLDMSAALRHSNSAYILRHLMAGVNLAGLVTGTTSQPLAWSLLHPAGSSETDPTLLQWNSPALGVPQVQRRLLDLLESPLVTTPLRLAICRALDQTVRLPTGLDAFLGRECRTQSQDDVDFDLTDDGESKSNSDRYKSEAVDSFGEQGEEQKSQEVTKKDEAEYKPEIDVHMGNKDPLMDAYDQTDSKKRTPYQRFLLLVCSTKNSRVVNAYQRLLNKVHAYEMLLEFHKLVGILQTGKHLSVDADIKESLLIENQLVYYLNQITELWRNADELIAHPRATLPGPMVLDASKKQCYNAYPDLCSQFDSTHVLDDVNWILALLLSSDSSIRSDRLTEVFLKAEQNEMATTLDVKPSIIVLTDAVSDSLENFLRSLICHPTGLVYIASRSKSCARLLDLCLNGSVTHSVPFDALDQLHDQGPANFLILGLELAYKLEALRCVDILVAWARKKGITGVHSTAAQLRAEFNTAHDVDIPSASVEPGLRDALFGLARLSCNGLLLFCPSIPAELVDFIGPIVTCSAPVWVADVVGMDDNFVPLLMLLEALSDETASKVNSLSVRFPDNLRDTGDSDKNAEASFTPAAEAASSVACETPATVGIRTTLKQLLAIPLDVPSLITVVVLNLLRHGENVSYLDRYGPRMASLVSPQNWEDQLSDPVALGLFTRLRTFSRSAAAPFLAWLRDCPARPSTALAWLSPTPCNPLSSSSFTWLTAQLKPLISELEEALEALIGLETAEDLLLVPSASGTASATNATSGLRKAPFGQGFVHGRCLPSALLVLLRLIRTHVCGASSRQLHSTQPAQTNPEHQVVLNQTLALIELYSANGLQLLMSLVQKIAEHFLIQCQATLCQSTCPSDVIGISPFNANISMLLAVLENAVQLIVSMLTTILRIRGNQFSDLTPIRTLCLAYTCATYTMSPPGAKAGQLSRIRDASVAGIMAYIDISSPYPVKVEDLEKSMWTNTCKEVITFTLAAPIHYLSGVNLLLDLLPLRLPVVSLNPLTKADQDKICAMRDSWALHVCSFVHQITGLIELLGATDPRSTNVLYRNILDLVHRVADLGAPCATALATACLDSLFSVWNELVSEANKKKGKTSMTNLDNTNGDSDDKVPSNVSDSRPVIDVQSNLQPARTPSSRLLLLTCPSSTGDPDPLDASLLAESGNASVADSDACASQRAAPSQPIYGQLLEPFVELHDTSEISSTLCLLYINLQVPACRFALLQLLRPGSSMDSEQVSTVRTSKSHDDGIDTSSSDRCYHQQFCQLVCQILSPCSDKPCHLRTQMILLQCLDQMLDIGVALKAFDHGFSWPEPDSSQSVTDELTRLSEGLPDSQLCAELVQSLIKHVGHVDRDMSTLPHALHPLLLLTQHDQGFRLVRDALESPIAQINGQHLFASLVQRVNDCFSTENPDCQTTLAVCLQLLQSMVVGRASLPLTFTPDEVTQSDLQDNFDQGERMVEESAATSCPPSAPVISIARFRHWHISGCKVRTFLGWSGVGDEGKPVRDLHALLEMLTDDEPSLEYLRTGMKNLLALLSEEFDVSGCDPVSNQETISDCGQSTTADSLPPWPEPRSLERLFAERPYFVAISDTACSKVVSQRRLVIARRRYHCAADLLNPPTTCLVTTGSSDQLTCNLTEMAQTCCNGLSIRDELLKCGRKRDSGDSAIRHQKRRRGQASIIETGRTSKKFVAPMRGRGFVLRSGPGSSVSAGAAGAQHGSGSSSTGVAGGRPDPFRSRPLNTSRPPSLHVDDFTKLVKDDNVMEEMPRQRPYRDGRGFRGGRGQRIPSNRGGVNVGGTGGSSTGSGIGVAGVNSQSGMLSGGPSLLPNLPLGLGVQPISSLNAAAAAAAAALLPSWSTDNRPISLLPFGLDSRSVQSRRDRSMR